jgi:hypothetical protein
MLRVSPARGSALGLHRGEKDLLDETASIAFTRLAAVDLLHPKLPALNPPGITPRTCRETRRWCMAPALNAS